MHLKIIDILHKKTSSYYASYTDTCYQTVSYCSKYETITYECGTETYTERNCGWSWECKYEPKCGYFIDGVKCDKWFLFICLHWSLKYSYKCIYVKSCGWVLKCEDVQKERPKYCSEERCVSKEERKEPYSCIKRKLVTRETDYYKVEVNGRTYEGNQEPLELNVPRGYVHVKDLVDGEEWDAHFMPLIPRRSEGEERVFDYRSGESHEGAGFDLNFLFNGLAQETLNAFMISFGGVLGVAFYLSRRYYGQPLKGLITRHFDKFRSDLNEGLQVNVWHIVTGEDMTTAEMVVDMGMDMLPAGTICANTLELTPVGTFLCGASIAISAYPDVRDSVRFLLGREDAIVGGLAMAGLISEIPGLSETLDPHLAFAKNFFKRCKGKWWYKYVEELRRVLKKEEFNNLMRRLGKKLDDVSDALEKEKRMDDFFAYLGGLMKKVKGLDGWEDFMREAVKLNARIELPSKVDDLSVFTRALREASSAEEVCEKLKKMGFRSNGVAKIIFKRSDDLYGEYDSFRKTVVLNTEALKRLDCAEVFELVHHEYLHSFTFVMKKEINRILAEFSWDEIAVNEAHDLLTLALIRKADLKKYETYRKAFEKFVEERELITKFKKYANTIEKRQISSKLYDLLKKEGDVALFAEWLAVKGGDSKKLFKHFMDEAITKSVNLKHRNFLIKFKQNVLILRDKYEDVMKLAK